MNTTTRSDDTLESPASAEEQVVAQARYLLATVAAWTEFLFDAGAPRRLSKAPPTVTREPDNYREPGSAGHDIERSATLAFVRKARQLHATGQWSGTRAQLHAAATIAAPIRALLSSPQALAGPYDDLLIDPDAVTELGVVLDAFYWRRELLRGSDITLPGIARVAGLAEKTVRMLARPSRRDPASVRSDDPALYTTKSGSRTWVTAGEAERWLSLKPTYHPTRFARSGANLSPRTAVELAATLEELRVAVKLSSAEVVEQLGLPAAAVPDYEQMEGGWWDPMDVALEYFDTPTLLKLASVLKVRQPTNFVQALREILTPLEIVRASARKTPARS